MAATLNFKFVANDKGLQNGIKRSQKSLRGLDRVTAGVSRSMASAFRRMAAGVGFYALARGLANASRAAQEDARSQRLLALQLDTTLKATDKQRASVEKFINSLSRQTGIQDDELRPSYAKLVRATGSIRSATKLLRIALDGSAASGKDLTAVTDVLSKAYNGNFMSLYKLAPQLKATKGGIDDYAKSVAGAAKTAADPFSKAKVAFKEIQEQIGTALLPALTGLADWLTKHGPAIQQWISDLFNPKTAVGYQFKQLGDSFDRLFKRFDPKGKDGLVGFFTVLNTLLIGTAQLLGVILDTVNAIAGVFDSSAYKNGVLNSVGYYTGASGQLGKKRDTIYGAGTVMQSNSTYNINLNQTNMTGADVIKRIKEYEKSTGVKYLTK